MLTPLHYHKAQKTSAIMCFLRCRIPPTSFAILRIQKLKSFADVRGSLSHNYRNRETLNADDARTHLNEHELDTNEKYMSAIRDRIPEKQIKDTVLCIEHLVTASPEWGDWGTEKEIEFFEKTPFWRKIAAEILGELFIHLFFALVFLFASSIWAVYFLVGWGALFLAIPYLALLYYLYRKACSKQTK